MRTLLGVLALLAEPFGGADSTFERLNAGPRHAAVYDDYAAARRRCDAQGLWRAPEGAVEPKEAVGGFGAVGVQGSQARFDAFTLGR